jgi:hypothetical protein
VRLVPRRSEAALAPSAHAPAESAPAGATPPERPATAKGRPRVMNPRESAQPPAASTGKKRKDSLVTDYPF